MSEVHTFGTDMSSRIGLGIAFGFIAALGIKYSLDGAYLMGPAGMIGGVGAWLHYATWRVTVTPDQLIMRRYGFVTFVANRTNIRASVGRGSGLNKTHAALILETPGQQRVELLRTLFGRTTLTELAQLLGAREPNPGGPF